MRREFHVRFCEGPRVRFPRATRRNVYVRSKRAGERVMGALRRIYAKLRLRVNESKSAVARPQDRKLALFVESGGSVRRGSEREAGTALALGTPTTIPSCERRDGRPG
jgi:hypothetical protein